MKCGNCQAEQAATHVVFCHRCGVRWSESPPVLSSADKGRSHAASLAAIHYFAARPKHDVTGLHAQMFAIREECESQVPKLRDLRPMQLPPSCLSCCYSANFSYGAKVCDKGLPPTYCCREWDTADDMPWLRRLWYRLKCAFRKPNTDYPEGVSG